MEFLRKLSFKEDMRYSGKRERKKALAFSEGVSLVNECLARKLVSLVDKEESAGDMRPPGLWIRKERENPGCQLHE
jgi:hypothetical protein